MGPGYTDNRNWFLYQRLYRRGDIGWAVAGPKIQHGADIIAGRIGSGFGLSILGSIPNDHTDGKQ